MKRIKKFASLLLAVIMVLAMAIPTYAAGETTGSITIKDAANVSVAEKTFNAYKILDVKAYSGSNVAYTVPEAMKSFYNGRYGLSGNESNYDTLVVEKINAETDRFAFAKAALAAAKPASGNTPDGTATAAEGATSVEISPLPLGYYVVEDTGAKTPVSALILDTTNPNPQVFIKADKPTIDKNIVDGSSEVKNNNAAVGDVVNYKLYSRVPDMTGYEKYYFVVNDTLSAGLDFNRDDVAITLGGKKLAEGTDYTVSVNDHKVKIVFNDFIQYNKAEFKDARIIITYSATVNENAVIGVEGNPNEVTLVYSNNPNTDESGNPGDEPGDDSPTGTTPKSETRTYVTGVNLIKVDPDSNKLTGAQFEITGVKTNIVLVTGEVFEADANGTYWLLTDGTYTTVDPSTEGIDTSKYQDTTTKYVKKTVEKAPMATKENVKATGLVKADGTISFEGLSTGTYTIREIKAPDGYNKLKEPITVVIIFTAPDPSTGSTDCTWTYDWKLGNEKMEAEEDSANTVSVVNNTGMELPSTGGMGTTIFYVLGSILLVGAVVLLVTKKRMSSEQ